MQSFASRVCVCVCVRERERERDRQGRITVESAVLQFFPIANTQFFKLVWFYQNI